MVASLIIGVVFTQECDNAYFIKQIKCVCLVVLGCN